MKRKQRLSRRVRETLLDHCGQIGADDCIDPTDFFKAREGKHKTDSRSQQLCRQVAQAISLSLGDCDDDRMQELTIMAVSPAPDSSRLLVTLQTDREAKDLEELNVSVNAQLGRLRSEVARSIHRKRVPNLTFQVIPREVCDGD